MPKSRGDIPIHEEKLPRTPTEVRHMSSTRSRVAILPTRVVLVLALLGVAGIVLFAVLEMRSASERNPVPASVRPGQNADAIQLERTSEPNREGAIEYAEVRVGLEGQNVVANVASCILRRRCFRALDQEDGRIEVPSSLLPSWAIVSAEGAVPCGVFLDGAHNVYRIDLPAVAHGIIHFADDCGVPVEGVSAMVTPAHDWEERVLGIPRLPSAPPKGNDVLTLSELLDELSTRPADVGKVLLIPDLLQQLDSGSDGKVSIVAPVGTPLILEILSNHNTSVGSWFRIRSPFQDNGDSDVPSTEIVLQDASTQSIEVTVHRGSSLTFAIPNAIGTWGSIRSGSLTVYSMSIDSIDGNPIPTNLGERRIPCRSGDTIWVNDLVPGRKKLSSALPCDHGVLFFVEEAELEPCQELDLGELSPPGVNSVTLVVDVPSLDVQDLPPFECSLFERGHHEERIWESFLLEGSKQLDMCGLREGHYRLTVTPRSKGTLSLSPLNRTIEFQVPGDREVHVSFDGEALLSRRFVVGLPEAANGMGTLTIYEMGPFGARPIGRIPYSVGQEHVEVEAKVAADATHYFGIGRAFGKDSSAPTYQIPLTPGGAQGGEVLLVAERAGVLSARSSGPDSDGSQTLWITLYGHDDDVLTTARSDASGHFEVTGLPSGVPLGVQGSEIRFVMPPVGDLSIGSVPTQPRLRLPQETDH